MGTRSNPEPDTRNNVIFLSKVEALSHSDQSGEAYSAYSQRD